MKHIALFLAAASAATILGCGGEDPTRAPAPPRQNVGAPAPNDSSSETGDHCLGSIATCDTNDHDPPVENLPSADGKAPPVDDRPAPSDDGDPTEEPPPPVIADPCAEFPWLKAAAGKEYRCDYANGESDVCTLELPEEPDGVCAAKCRPAFYETADRLQHVESTTFTFEGSSGQATCSPLN